jgi:uncharacterized protein (DUF849 family)
MMTPAIITVAITGTMTWSAAGIARHQLEVNRWCLELGGHLRTGLEDNIKFDNAVMRSSSRDLRRNTATMGGIRQFAPRRAICWVFRLPRQLCDRSLSR